MNVGEPKISASEAIGQAFMVNSQNVQNGCMEIVHRADIFYGEHSHFVSCTVHNTAFYTATSKPDGEAFWMVVTAVATA